MESFRAARVVVGGGGSSSWLSAFAQIPHAATGPAAAWLLTNFAGFRIVTFLVPEAAARDALAHLKIRESAEGANVWVVVPKDERVFQGARDIDGIRCVHPVQAYFDLSGHPERAREAAGELRARLLTWKRDG